MRPKMLQTRGHLEASIFLGKPNNIITKILFLYHNDHLTDSDVDEEEVDARYDGQLLTHLVGDVSEVGLDDALLEPFLDLTASGRKSKSSKKNNNKPPKRARVTTTTNVSR